MGRHGVRYSPETRERALRLLREPIAGDDRTQAQRYAAVAKTLGMTVHTLRSWVRQAEVDAGEREGVTSTTLTELAELRARNAELEQTVEILKAATSFFARECDPLSPSSAGSSSSTGTGCGCMRRCT